MTSGGDPAWSGSSFEFDAETVAANGEASSLAWQRRTDATPAGGDGASLQLHGGMSSSAAAGPFGGLIYTTLEVQVATRYAHHLELGSMLQANQPFQNAFGGPFLVGLHLFCLCVGATGDAVGRTVRLTNFELSQFGFFAATSGGAPLATNSNSAGVFETGPEFYTFTGDEAYTAAGAATMFDVVLSGTIPENLYAQSMVSQTWGRVEMIEKLGGTITTPVDPIGDYEVPSTVTIVTGYAAIASKLGPTGSEFVNDPDAILPITDWTYTPDALGGSTTVWDQYVVGGTPADGPVRWEVA